MKPYIKGTVRALEATPLIVDEDIVVSLYRMKKYLPGRRGREGIPGKENRSQARAVTLENARCVSVAL